MSDFITAATSLFDWRILVIVVPCSVVIVAVLWSDERSRRADARAEAVRRHRADLSRDTLAFVRDPEAQRDAAQSFARRTAHSPAMQREAAPWFGDGGAA